MKRVRYKKYDGDLASEIDLEDLLQSLSDYFLDSGFRDPYSDFQDLDHNLTTCAKLCAACLKKAAFLTKTCSARSTSSPRRVNSTS